MPKVSAEKLLIKPGSIVWPSDASRITIADPPPEDVQVTERAGEAAVALVFAPDAETLVAALRAHGAQLPAVPTTWVIYPKGNVTDLNRDTLWPALTPYGLRPVGQVAVDDTWSALRFRALKEGEEPFRAGKR
jgi:hypothetical protein